MFGNTTFIVSVTNFVYVPRLAKSCSCLDAKPGPIVFVLISALQGRHGPHEPAVQLLCQAAGWRGVPIARRACAAHIHHPEHPAGGRELGTRRRNRQQVWPLRSAQTLPRTCPNHCGALQCLLRVGYSGDRTFTDPVDIEVTVAPEQVQATVLQQMLDDTIAAYVRHLLASRALPIRSQFIWFAMGKIRVTFTARLRQATSRAS